MGGSSVNEISNDPLFTDVDEPFLWASISQGEIASDTVLLATEATYTWPSPIVGQYIEVGDDGVRRQITAIGDDTTRTITFTPALSAPYCGRATDCRGVRVLGWGAASTGATGDFALAVGSPSIDAGLYIDGVHCSFPDDNGGSSLTGCIHWNGSAPDVGYIAGVYTPAPLAIRALINGAGSAILSGPGSAVIQ